MFLMIDDRFTDHEKFHMAGEHGQALWFSSAVKCAAANREGLIPAHMVRAWSPTHFTPARLTAATKALVRSGLWHDHESLCGRCLERHGELAKGDYRFHDWLDWQLQARAKDDPIVKMRERRRKQLHRRADLKNAIRMRDRDLCRYCGVAVIFGTGDHKSMTSGQFDHIDPFDPENALAKILTSCKRCNVEKGERTPEQAGMTIHEPGYQAPIQTDGMDIQTASQTGGLGSGADDPDPSSRDARLGTEPDRDGSPAVIQDPDPDHETTETGEDHA